MISVKTIQNIVIIITVTKKHYHHCTFCPPIHIWNDIYCLCIAPPLSSSSPSFYLFWTKQHSIWQRMQTNRTKRLNER